MPTAATFARTSPAYIESGTVIDVDISNYTLTVYTQFTSKPLYGLSFAVPYHHYSNGEGIYFMPEVGSICWVAFPSDGMRPFVMSWAPARSKNTDSLKSGRLALNPGDIYLGTRDDNFLILRRGGVVQIGGGPLNQRMYIPLNNTIRDFCENYQLHTLAGDLVWTVLRDENSTDGKRPSILRLAAREFADDALPIALLEIGSSEAPNPPIDSSHTGDISNILSLTINASGQEGAAEKIRLNFRKDGSAYWEFQGKVEMYSGSDISIYAYKTLSLMGKDIIASGDRVAIKSANSMEVTAPTGTKFTTPVLKLLGDLKVEGHVAAGTGATGTFLSFNGKTVTVLNGIVVSIV
jgi:hypothetical protein